MEKDFTGWHAVKAALHAKHTAPTFQEREVWWCSIGMNIGDEMDGKSRFYNRPVLVIRKFNSRIFLGVPLSTQLKENPYYHRIHFKQREQCVMLSQLRLWEAKRLTHKMGKLPEEQFEGVRRVLKEMV